MTLIKLPPCYDISHWKEVRDFKVVEPKPLLFITKASEAYPGTGYNHTDDKFVRFAEGMMEIGCFRGFYHFNRRAFDGKRQGEHFVSVISQIDILPSDILILDVEEGGEKASQLWAWFETVRQAYPSNPLMIYSRKNILDAIVMTAGEKAYFKRILTWTAGYPFLPDLYSSVPSGYVPDQSKFGPVALWQYTAHGRVAGVTDEFGRATDVDMNWMAPWFVEQLGTFSLGVKTMANYVGTAKETAKVWNVIGGQRVYPDVKKGEKILADAKQGEYLHLTSPVAGWTKAVWFDYREQAAPPPPPPVEEPQPEQPPADDGPDYIVAHWANGTTKKYIPE